MHNHQIQNFLTGEAWISFGLQGLLNIIISYNIWQIPPQPSHIKKKKKLSPKRSHTTRDSPFLGLLLLTLPTVSNPPRVNVCVCVCARACMCAWRVCVCMHTCVCVCVQIYTCVSILGGRPMVDDKSVYVNIVCFDIFLFVCCFLV